MTGLATLTLAILLAQSPPPAFEVASVKVSPEGNNGLTNISPAGGRRFTATNATLQLLIQFAFGIDETQIVNAPGWIETEKYDVAAQTEAGGLTYDQLKPLLQKLLEERFQLTHHPGSKDETGYALVVAKGGPKLTKSTGAEGGTYILPDGVQGPKLPMAALAGMLSRHLHAPVVDETGIPGDYEINLKFAPEGDTTSNLPSLFTAIQEKLGLRLVSKPVKRETLIIDHVERIPSTN